MPVVGIISLLFWQKSNCSMTGKGIEKTALES